MSDPVILALITAVGTFCGVLLTGVMAYLMARLAQQGKQAAEKVAEVADKADDVKVVLKETTAETGEKLDKLAMVAEASQKTGDKIHGLVNSQYGIQLRLGADLSRWKADQTKKPEDIAAANLAQSLHEDHEKKQAALDKAEGLKPKGK